MCIGTLLSMPCAEGLFRRAIAQSGAAHHVISADDGHRIGEYLAEKLGVPPTREAIAAVLVERLLTGQTELKGGSSCPSVPWALGAGGGGERDAVAAGDRWGSHSWSADRADHGRRKRAGGSHSRYQHRGLEAVPGHKRRIDQITDEILTGPVRVYGYQALAAYGLPIETALAAY